MTQPTDQQIRDFIEAALPPHYNHREGGLEEAAALLEKTPSLAAADFYTSVMTGELDAFRSFLAADSSLATTKGGPAEWEPLLYLSFSRFLRFDEARAENMLAIARELLDAGADPNAFFMNNHEKETVLYGASGVANNPGLTKMLLDAGVDPNEEESPYHSVEFTDMRCALLLVEAGLNEHWQATMLLHKLDMDDLPGYRQLLEGGLDPNLQGKWGQTALHFAITRFRALPFFETLVEFGADVNALDKTGRSVYALAARFGRSDVMDFLVSQGASTDMSDPDRFIAACTNADEDTVRSMVEANPKIVAELPEEDTAMLAEIARWGRLDSVRLMLDVGFSPKARGLLGGTALHWSGWEGHGEIAKLLLENGAPLEMTDTSYQNTPLGWAVYGSAANLERKADGDHYAIVDALLKAGAKVHEYMLEDEGTPEVSKLLKKNWPASKNN